MSSTHKVAVAVALLWSGGVFLFESEVAHANHVGCGSVITTDTVLDSDLTCPAEGIVIGADNITLDLNGHTLTGPGLTCTVCGPFDSVPDGVRVERRNGVTIKNGYIAGFVFGIRLVDADSNVVDQVVTTNSTFNGISLFADSDNNLVTHCTSSDNGAFGVIINSGSDGNLVEHCLLAGNSTGLFVGGGGGGAPSFGNRVEHNGVRNNSSLGIHVRNADANVLEYNVVETNDSGIVISEGADRNLARQNIVNDNSRSGLLLPAPSTDFPEPEDNQLIRNRLHGNGTSGAPGARDIRDATTGEGSADTRNYYKDNQCGTSFPEGLCGL
jgi:parallel beta-helix repeat protein